MLTTTVTQTFLAKLSRNVVSRRNNFFSPLRSSSHNFMKLKLILKTKEIVTAAVRISCVLTALFCGNPAMAGSPVCSAVAGETKVSWPSAAAPTWELCWLKPSLSSGPSGSGLELRNVYFRGVLVIKRAHAPMLFAEYRNGSGGDCYRDWKDEDSSFLAEPGVRDILGTSINFSATTTCDVSNAPTASFGACRFQLPGRTTADCNGGGVAIENLPSGMGFRLTTQHAAAWYQYTARYEFFADGNIEAKFGFGNLNGTFNNVTHWHHNYWRFDFDIDGAGNDTINFGGSPISSEFAATRSAAGAYSVTDANAGFGYLISPGANDDTFPANQSGRGFHLVDVIGSAYHADEYGDRSDNNLGDCAMNAPAIANSENISKTDVVLYYRASVRDTTANDWALPGGGFAPQDSMVCKRVGPMLQLIGNFPIPAGDFRLFKDGME
jgi:hypothetical protein